MSANVRIALNIVFQQSSRIAGADEKNHPPIIAWRCRAIARSTASSPALLTDTPLAHFLRVNNGSRQLNKALAP